MKKHLLIAFLFTSYLVSAQSAFPLVKEGGIWREFFSSWDSQYPNDPPTYSRWQFDMLGDTTINGMTYKKLYYINNYDSVYQNLQYYGALREDSLKRVYVLSHDIATAFNISDSIELLLYDFNVSVGDTVKIPNTHANTVVDNIVTKVDSAVVSGQWRKRIYMRGYGVSQRVWIEGIGDQKGLFFPYGYEFENYRMLSCYEDSNTYWTSPWLALYGGDCFKVGIDKQNEDFKDNLVVFPNPATDFINFLFTKAIGQESILSIYNSMGQKVGSYSISKFQLEVKFSTTSFAKGIFYYQLDSNTKTIGRGIFIKE